jgi:hypothetical protein
MSSFGLRLCGLRAIKVKGFFLPVERKPYPGQNLLDNHNRWIENDPAFFSTSMRARRPGHSESNFASGRRNEGDIGDGFGWGFSVPPHRLRWLAWSCSGAYGAALRFAFLVLAF